MLIQHSVIYFFSRALPGVVNLLALVLYTHLLNPEEYGRYALVIYGVGLVNTLLYWWLRLGLIRFAPRYIEDQAVFLAALLRGFVLVGGVSAIIAAASFVLIKDAQLRLFISFSTLLLWGTAWFEVNLELIRSRFSPIYFGALSFVRAVIALVVGGGLVWAGYSVWGLLFGVLVSVLLPGVWEYFKSWRGINIRRIDYALLRELFIYGLPLVGVFGMEYVVSSSDRFMLGWLMDAGATGTYSAAYDLTNQSLTLAMSVVYLAGYPLIVKTLEAEGVLPTQRLLSRYLGIFLAIALPATIIVAVLAKGISGTLLGSRFHEDAVGVMPWVAMGTLFAALKAYYFDIAFQLSRRTSRQILVIAFPALLNVLLNLWWIPRMGVVGAAYATFAAYVCAAVMSWRLGRREFVMPVLSRDVIGVFSSAAVMAVVAIILLNKYDQVGIFNWVSMAVILVGVYGGMVLLLNIGEVRTWLVLRARAFFNRGTGL